MLLPYTEHTLTMYPNIHTKKHLSNHNDYTVPVEVILAVMKQLKQLQKKLRRVWRFNGIQTHDLHNTNAMLYQLSYEALLGLQYT